MDRLVRLYCPEIADMVGVMIPRGAVAPYFILLDEGGIFAGNDMECIEPFDDFAREQSCCLPAAPGHGDADGVRVSDSLLIAEKGHPFLRFAVSRMKAYAGLLGSRDSIFVNKVLGEYDGEAGVGIAPAAVLDPLTRDDAMLYRRGMLHEDKIEKKLAEALSCRCYGESLKKGVGVPDMEERRTDVLYLSAFVGDVGATIAGYRIHSGLRARGVNSKMLVMFNSTEGRNFDDDAIYIARPAPGENYGLRNDMKPLKRYPESGWYATGTAGIDISGYIEKFDPRIVQLHFINFGYLTIEDIGRIDRKVVWRLPDCWPFTGGCCYNGACRKYVDECGDCPQLHSDDRYDMSHHIWMRKERAFRNMDMTIVVPTPWMEKLARESSLFRDRDIVVIPNGLDPDDYYPVDKAMAREALGIPAGKKVVLYGAAGAVTDKRKGFDILREALQKLAPVHKEEWYVVIFGASEQELGLDMPVKFLGYVRDHYMLQLAYSAADVMVVPSREEAFGQTVIEAMACSCPVVSFLETGPAGIVDHERNGYLARFCDPDDLAAGIEWVLSDEDLAARLGRNARRKVETTYDIKIVAEQYERLYERILNS